MSFFSYNVLKAWTFAILIKVFIFNCFDSDRQKMSNLDAKIFVPTHWAVLGPENTIL